MVSIGRGQAETGTDVDEEVLPPSARLVERGKLTGKAHVRDPGLEKIGPKEMRKSAWSIR